MRMKVVVGAILVVLGLSLAAGYLGGGRWMSDPPALQTGTALAEPRPVSAFDLVDQHGMPFTRERLRGRWTLLFLGFTHCPDVCPQTLAILNAAHALLEDGADERREIQTVFVSVDPDRDSPVLLGEYAGFFNQQFIAVTGSKPQLDQLTESLGFAYVMVPISQGRYTVDHSTAVALIDPDARAAAYFRQPLDAETLAADVTTLTSEP
ncbi:MAG: SCO family protein [Wenzhouxiangella sp.]